MKIPENKEEIEKFVFEKLKEEYGDDIVDYSEVSSQIVVSETANPPEGEDNDVWIGFSYFH